MPGDAFPFGIEAASGPASTFDVFTPRPPVQPGITPYLDPGTASGGPAGPGGPAAPFSGGGAPSSPGAGQAAYPDQPAPFPGWTVRNPPTAPGGRGTSGPVGPATPMTPVASPRPAQEPGPPWEISRETGPLPEVTGGSGSDADGTSDIKGLPRRVRQASLAPQLRDSPPPRRTTVASAGLTGGSQGPSPAEIRQTMSSLQRGWQEGRAQMASQPPGTSPAGGEASTASEETGGDSDGS
jgi:hypothetical protein